MRRHVSRPMIAAALALAAAASLHPVAQVAPPRTKPTFTERRKAEKRGGRR